MASAPTYNAKNPAVKRIMQEIKEVQADTSGDFMAEALEVRRVRMWRRVGVENALHGGNSALPDCPQLLTSNDWELEGGRGGSRDTAGNFLLGTCCMPPALLRPLSTRRLTYLSGILSSGGQWTPISRCGGVPAGARP
jgi:hypothetical protein